MSQHEHTPYNPHQYEMEQLQLILDQMSTQSPLPLAGTPEALADHEGWMKRFHEIAELEVRACYIALLALPREVNVLYQAIQRQKNHLLNLGKTEQQQCHMQEQASTHPVVSVPSEA